VLLDALEDEYWQVRLKAARSLGKLGVVEAAPILGPMMATNIPNLRKECAAVLGTLALEESTEFLTVYEDDADPDVRKNVRWALAQIKLGAA